MHRTYSMRQSRAPTASQIQTPPPPSSSTKGGRFFGKANIGKISASRIQRNIILTTVSDHRPQLPQVGPPGRFRTRPCEEAVAAGEDGEERDALHGACWQGAHGSRGRQNTTPRVTHRTDGYDSNNSPSGVRCATTMFPMSPTSSVCSFTRLASLRINSSIVTISTVLQSRAFATSKPLCSQAETVSIHRHATDIKVSS